MRSVETVQQDVRYAWRGLRARRGFTLVVVLSLALGIGANTAAFTLLYAALLRPAPVPAPDQLVQLVAYDASGDQPSHFGYPLFTTFRHDLREHGEAFAIASQRRDRLVIDGQGLERAVVEPVTANYFSALRVGASEGRLFVDADDRVTGGEPVAVISHAYRERRFGGSAGTPVVGRTIVIDDSPFTIVGVAAPGFDGLEAQRRTDIWLPMTAKLPPHWLTSYGSMVMVVMARMRPDADVGQATAIADVTFRRFLEEHVLPPLPLAIQRELEQRHLRLRGAASGVATLGYTYRQPLFILMGTVALILLLCCANVANLLLARQRGRDQEFAVRLSLGAGPGRLARQLLTETLMLGGMGACLGFVLALWGSHGLMRLLPESGMPMTLDLSPDMRVFTFAAIVSLFAAIAVGLIPAWRAAHTDAGVALTHTTRTVLRSRTGRSLVVVQLAGSLVLLVTALLMARTLQNLRLADLGFRPQQVLAFDLSLPKTLPASTKAALYQRIVDRLDAAPGVASVTYSRESLYSDGGWADSAKVPGVDDAGVQRDTQIALLSIGPHFFETAGMTRMNGRVFDADDHRPNRRVVVINETAARYFFGAIDVVGRALVVGGAEREVIGVTKDVKHYGVREQPCGGRVAYLPTDPATAAGTFLVRGTLPASELQRVVREELRDTGDTVLLERLRPLEADVDHMVARERMVGRLAGGFALLALVIAMVGVYGVLAYGVSQRIGEMGLRAALGAGPAALRRMVLREALMLVGIGVLFGVPIAFACVRLLGRLLFGVTSSDPITFTLAALVLTATASLAAWLPARRAASVDPTTALRGV